MTNTPIVTIVCALYPISAYDITGDTVMELFAGIHNRLSGLFGGSNTSRNPAAGKTNTTTPPDGATDGEAGHAITTPSASPSLRDFFFHSAPLASPGFAKAKPTAASGCRLAGAPLKSGICLDDKEIPEEAAEPRCPADEIAHEYRLFFQNGGECEKASEYIRRHNRLLQMTNDR